MGSSKSNPRSTRRGRRDLGLDDPKKIAEVGESLYQELQKKPQVLGKSGYVVFHIASRQHVLGQTREDARRQYEQRFGNEPGYVRKIGELP